MVLDWQITDDLPNFPAAMQTFPLYSNISSKLTPSISMDQRNHKSGDIPQCIGWISSCTTHVVNGYIMQIDKV